LQHDISAFGHTLETVGPIRTPSAAHFPFAAAEIILNH